MSEIENNSEATPPPSAAVAASAPLLVPEPLPPAPVTVPPPAMPRWAQAALVILAVMVMAEWCAVALAWVRALGEFGAVLIVAYYPQGIPVKLWVNLQNIGLSAVYPLLWIFFLVAMPLPLILGLAARHRRLI